MWVRCPFWFQLAIVKGGGQATNRNMSATVLHSDPEEKHTALRNCVALNPVFFASEAKRWPSTGRTEAEVLWLLSPLRGNRTWTKHKVPYENKTLICQGKITATPTHPAH